MKRLKTTGLVAFLLMAAHAVTWTQSEGRRASAGSSNHPVKAMMPERTGSAPVSSRIPPERSMAAPAVMTAPTRHLFGDVDGDGLADLFALDAKGNILFRNIGNGGFEEVTSIAFPEGAGIGGSGFFGDYNGDGRLDLFLFPEEGFILFQNDGKLRFSDVTETLGMPGKLRCSAATLKDYDGDGFEDLLVQTPGGDRIFRNQKGRKFSEVALENPANRDSRTRGKVPPIQSLGGPASPSLGSSGSPTFDAWYVNDNSPGSVGIGIPEVEGGDDAATQNDIVDGTVTGMDIQDDSLSGADLLSESIDGSDILDGSLTGSDLQDGSITGADIQDGTLGGEDIQDGSLTGADLADDSVPPGKVTGTAATLSGDQNFDSGTLYIDSANHRVGVGTASPDEASMHAVGSSEYVLRAENTASSGFVYGVYGENSSANGGGIYGMATSVSGTAIGVVGESDSDEGIGIFGGTNALTGYAVGVYGWTYSDSSSAVLGYADADTGNTIGVEGDSRSTSGTGVEGYASAGTGYTRGVHGWCNSTTGKGVQGSAYATTGTTYGVFGLSISESGRGVYGQATRSFGNTFGVVGESNSDAGIGVFGFTTNLSGASTGVYGWIDSDSGEGVLGHADAASGDTVGVEGSSESDSGIGVVGYANAASGVTAGVQGWCESSSGKGVYGVADSTTGAAYGVYGWSRSDSGRGVYGRATDPSGKTVGVVGASDSKAGVGVSGSASALSGTTYGVLGTAASSSGFGVYSKGDFGASGTKSFVQPHPTDPSREIRFVCLEGNESGTYCRGSARLAGGRAVIEVPEAFRLVTEPDGLTVQVTPQSPIRIGVEEKSLDRIVVTGEADVEFDYFINGVRRGFGGFEPVRENRAWVPEYGDRPFGTQYPAALRRILVENGILNPDFTPNRKTAARMGWMLRDSEEEAAGRRESPRRNSNRKPEVLTEDRASTDPGFRQGGPSRLKRPGRVHPSRMGDTEPVRQNRDEVNQEKQHAPAPQEEAPERGSLERRQ